MTTLTDRDDGRRVTVHPGDVLELRLAENATAGYRWAPDGDVPAILALAAAVPDYPGGAPGAGGAAVFRFRVVGPGMGTLSLKCWRSWEGAGSVLRRFAVTVDAVP